MVKRIYIPIPFPKEETWACMKISDLMVYCLLSWNHHVPTETNVCGGRHFIFRHTPSIAASIPIWDAFPGWNGGFSHRLSKSLGNPSRLRSRHPSSCLRGHLKSHEFSENFPASTPTNSPDMVVASTSLTWLTLPGDVGSQDPLSCHWVEAVPRGVNKNMPCFCLNWSCCLITLDNDVAWLKPSQFKKKWVDKVDKSYLNLKNIWIIYEHFGCIS